MIHDAIYVNSKELLKEWLTTNRELAKQNLVQKVKYVSVNERFEITKMFFEGEEG